MMEYLRMEQKAKNWARDELIIAFNLYCRIPFGRIHKNNPDIIKIAKSIKRTPSSVAMKMVNFASLDPFHKKRNIKGLRHSSKQDEKIWDEFHKDWEKLAFESQKSLNKLIGKKSEDYEPSIIEKDMPTEVKRLTRVRLVQSFFREAVLSSYNYSCTVCKISLYKMLNASHIIPWSINKLRRADPSNGLSLCAFHDRAFDRGLITIDEDYKIILSKEVKYLIEIPKLHKVGLIEIEGSLINLPEKFYPDKIAIAYHRENIFLS